MNKHQIRDYLLVVAGATIMAFAIKSIYAPIGLVTGGVSGLAIIFKTVLGIPLWITNTVLNIPLFLISFWLKGWSFIKRSLVATMTLSVALYLLPEVALLTDDLLLAALFGGIISGIGAGLVFLAQATTGGTDMFAALIQRKLRHYSIAQIMQVIDALVVLIGASVFGIRFALYALIAIYGLSKVSDGIMEGLKYAKVAFIISNKNEIIAKSILEEMNRGVTALNGTGMYSGEERTVLYCVVAKKEIVQLKEIVVGHDSQSFIIVSDVREVLGEGFIEFKQ